ncbi:hypothetical protein ACM01_27890 [Streptomyces viridochromogenes]|uniref:Uncharacterized protein n=1 Tax=Streptomyces viridochromogenes TaxID=1938 RepID=A0A0J7Z6W6_STRVR|nr:hypothetical protein ACM01_27890 [Streptomyces viridochromogenes]KOG15895.1 hypothetical protein ADK36_28265 [Streptomyces viridochromogenes]KOG16684.1 hypothetical protein ADK35_26065 [Streptomyces viridochromogenes]
MWRGYGRRQQAPGSYASRRRFQPRPRQPLAIGVLKTLGADNIAKTTRAIRDDPQRALPILGITNDPDTYGT